MFSNRLIGGARESQTARPIQNRWTSRRPGRHPSRLGCVHYGSSRIRSSPRISPTAIGPGCSASGLVEPVDDLPAHDDPPSHPELLAYLEKEFLDHQYDPKHLLRIICRSCRLSSGAAELTLMRDPDGLAPRPIACRAGSRRKCCWIPPSRPRGVSAHRRRRPRSACALIAATVAGCAWPRMSGPHDPIQSMYSRPSASQTRAPRPRSTKRGCPPTARNARTGE